MLKGRLISDGTSSIGLLVGIILLAGCSPGTPVGQVTGIVTYNGSPLARAEVEFTPKGEGTSSVGFTNEAGEYELQYTLNRTGALIGKHNVDVQLLVQDMKAKADIRRASQAAKIECEVASGSNEINIELSPVELPTKRNR